MAESHFSGKGQPNVSNPNQHTDNLPLLWMYNTGPRGSMYCLFNNKVVSVTLTRKKSHLVCGIENFFSSVR